MDSASFNENKKLKFRNWCHIYIQRVGTAYEYFAHAGRIIHQNRKNALKKVFFALAIKKWKDSSFVLLFLCPSSSSSHMWKPFQKLRYITLKVLTCLKCFYCRCRTSSVFVSIYLSGAITDFHRLYVHVSVANYHYT